MRTRSISAPVTKLNPIREFVGLLLILSIPLWVLGSVLDVDVIPGLKLYQLPLAMPAVAGIILTYREEGRQGLGSLLRRAYDYRRINSKVWLIPILLAYPSIGLLDYAIQRVIGRELPAPRLSLPVLLAYSTVFFLTYGEELGLTGFALDHMTGNIGLTSALSIGAIWAGYHIPAFVISGFYSWSWIVWHAAYIVLGRVIFVWIYVNSGRSLFSMALLHSTFGLFWALWPATGNLQKATTAYDPAIAAIIMAIYAIIVIVLWRPATLAQYRFTRN